MSGFGDRHSTIKLTPYGQPYDKQYSGKCQIVIKPISAKVGSELSNLRR